MATVAIEKDKQSTLHYITALLTNSPVFFHTTLHIAHIIKIQTNNIILVIQ